MITTTAPIRGMTAVHKINSKSSFPFIHSILYLLPLIHSILYDHFLPFTTYRFILIPAKLKVSRHYFSCRDPHNVRFIHRDTLSCNHQ